MKHKVYACLAAAMLAGCQTTAKPTDNPSDYKQVALDAKDIASIREGVRRSLRDPDSARFGAIFATQKPGQAMFVCGYVNARNGFGGYSGDMPFVGVMSRIVAKPTFLLNSVASTPLQAKVNFDFCAEKGIGQIR